MADINFPNGNTYAGKLYAEYLTPAILAPAGLVNRGLVTPVETIKNKETLRGVNRVIDLQTPSAMFTAQAGNIDLSEKQLELVAYEVMDQIDAELLRTTWESEQQKPGSFEDYRLTPELYNFLLDKIYVPRMAIANEQLYLLGKSGVNGGEVATASFAAAYPGLLSEMTSDAAVRKISLPETAKAVIASITNGAANSALVTLVDASDVIVGDRVTITGADGNQTINAVTINGQTVTVIAKNGNALTIEEAVAGATAATTGTAFFVNQNNVLSVLTSVYMSIPQKVKKQTSNTGNGRTKIHVSDRIADAYRVANGLISGQGGSFTREGYFAQDALIPYLDIDLVAMPHWQDNLLAVWNPGNVFLGFDLLSDEVYARVLYLGDVTGDDVYRVKNRMKSDITYKYASEVYLYLAQ
jgi:hypothetical protein